MKIQRSSRLLTLTAAAILAAAATPTVRAATNLVTNGSFETNGGIGQLAGGITSIGGWTVGPVVVTANTPAGSATFDFVMNSNADLSGFPSVYSPPNIFMWGPHTPASAGGAVANGFTGSADGGAFFGSDGGYATAPISQTINGLTIGALYTLSLQYAAGQFSQYFGVTHQDWQITLGGIVYTTPTLNVASQGFSGWQNYTLTVPATSTSETLSFLAQGTPVGISPLTMLDGVSLTGAAAPEPSTWVLVGLGAVGMGLMVRRRRRA